MLKYAGKTCVPLGRATLKTAQCKRAYVGPLEFSVHPNRAGSQPCAGSTGRAARGWLGARQRAAIQRDVV